MNGHYATDNTGISQKRKRECKDPDVEKALIQSMDMGMITI
jgi:hypothetical protein